jgi:DNA-binding NarL/FixJ family response regulator
MTRGESKRVRLFVVEEQGFYREVYKCALSIDGVGSAFDVLGMSASGRIGEARRAISELKPDVLLVGTKRLESGLIEELERVRVAHPGMGVVLLMVSYDVEAMQSLRRIALQGGGGMALLLKQHLDHPEELSEVLIAASRGQVLVDPMLTTALLAEKSKNQLSGQLTPRETEILSLMSKGYTNAAIADSLCIDVKTVEHHINSLYGKLRAESDFDSKHPRVSAARLYLEATGQLLSPMRDSGDRGFAERRELQPALAR